VVGLVRGGGGLWPGGLGGGGGRGVVVAGAVLGHDGTGLGLGPALLLMTFDQWPWVIPAAVGWARSEPAERALLIGGASCVLASSVLGGGAWIGHGAFRIGLLLAAARGLAFMAETLAPKRVAPPTVLALVVFAAMSGGFLVWWDPFRMDEVARDSAPPVAPALEDAMEWVQANTAPEGSFVASAHYAAAVAVLGGRRVLRAPGLAEAPDEERRLRTERAIVAGRAVPELIRRYGLRYVLAAPGDFDEHGLVDPIDLQGRGGLRLRYVNDRGLRIYELPETGPPPAVK